MIVKAEDAECMNFSMDFKGLHLRRTTNLEKRSGFFFARGKLNFSLGVKQIGGSLPLRSPLRDTGEVLF